MSIKLIRKSIIMAPCIILVAAIIVLGTSYANADRKDSLLKKNKNIVAAWLSGGGSTGFSTLNGEEVGIIIINGIPNPIQHVTLVNLGREPIKLIGVNDRTVVLMTVDPDQTRSLMGIEPTPFRELRIIQDGGSGAPGLALWRVGFNPQPDPPRGF